MSSKIYCTRCSSYCHTDAWCPYKPTDYMERVIGFNDGLTEAHSRFVATDHEIRDGEVVEFRGFGALDGKQFCVERLHGAKDGGDVTLKLTEVKPL